MFDRAALMRRLLPAPADIVFILMLFAAAVLRGWQAVNTDGDLGRHLRVGETILQRGGLFYEDLFSWTMAGQRFVPYEWLSEVLFALAHRAAGIAGAVALTALVIAGSYLLLVLLLRRLGVDPLLAFLVAVAAGLVGAFHWLARPHVFTFLGTVSLLWLIEGADRGRPALPRLARLGLTALLFAVWANLHGGFLFGLVLLAMYLAGDAIASRELLPRHAALFLAALLGTMLNPVGPALLGHVTGYLGETFLVDTTLEYRSPDFHGWIGRAFLAMLLLMIGALALSRQPVRLRWLVVILGTSAFALHSVRNVPLWALTALPLAAMHLDGEWRALPSRVLTRLREGFAGADRMLAPGTWSALAALMLMVLAGNGGRWGRAQLIQDRFDPTVFPVEAVARARATGLDGRLFNELGWGGYLLYAWPEQKVFIDGQTDFYGEELSREYVALRSGKTGSEQRLEERGIRVVLIPPDAPLRASIERGPWEELYKSDAAVLLRASPSY